MKPLENLGIYEVVLASNSPRRKQLLADLGIRFTTHVIDGIDESFPADTPVMEVKTDMKGTLWLIASSTMTSSPSWAV